MSIGSLLSRFPGRRIGVIGDVMLDHFVVGHVDRISPEAPVPVVRFARDEFRLGGAANVAHNVAALGGRAHIIGLVGDDAEADRLRRELGAVGLGTSGLVTDSTRPTTRKVRVVTIRNQQVARIDYETDSEVTGRALDLLLEQITAAARVSDALVLSDYRKGVVTPAVVEAVASAAKAAGIPLLVDPKVPQADRYRGATLITPNHHEAELMTQVPIRNVDDARRAARVLRERTGASVLITWGEHGMFVSMRGASPTENGRGSAADEALPASAREVADVTGAGDTVIAVLALGLAAGGTLGESARLANLAAGLVVARFGPAALTAVELADAVADFTRAAVMSTRLIPARETALWARAFLVVAALLITSGFSSDDPDSALYAGIAGRLAEEPVARWIAPEWWGFWPEAEMTGLFREHPAGVFLLSAALTRVGIPAAQGAYVVGAFAGLASVLMMAWLIGRVATRDEARGALVLLQLMPVAFIFRMRANHEYPMLVCLLLALIGLVRVAEARSSWGTALVALGLTAGLFIKGVFVDQDPAGAGSLGAGESHGARCDTVEASRCRRHRDHGHADRRCRVRLLVSRDHR